MRYLVGVDNLFPDSPSGSSRVAWDIALAMERKGHDVTVVAARDRPELPLGVDHIQGIRAVRYDRAKVHRLNPLRYQKVIDTTIKELAQYLPGEEFDCIHLHTPLTGTAVYKAFPATDRVVYTMHSPVVMEMKIVWSQQGFMGKLKKLIAEKSIRRIEHNLLENADTIHTLSKFTRGCIDADYGLGHKVSVIPHWCRDSERRVLSKREARRKLGWPDDRPILFTVRRHVYRMGLDVSVDAVAPLAAEGNCRFYIGGDGELKQSLTNRARDLGASNTEVVFTGRLSEENLQLAYQAADCFVLPTRALECFGLIAIEAMGYGCPVIATTAGAIPEIVEPISPLLMVPPNDVDALRSTLEDWLNGKSVLPKENELQSYIDQNFSADIIRARLEKMLTSSHSWALKT